MINYVVFELIEVNQKLQGHIESLYELLKKKEHNISHESTPKYYDHINFVRSHPYRKWYLIEHLSNVVGSVYLTNDNVIGINLPSKGCQDYIELINLILASHKPLRPINSVRSKYFLINTNPNNLNLISALKSLNMHHIQNTYALKDLL